MSDPHELITRPNVLLLEDDELLGELFTRGLARDGRNVHRFATAEDVDAALRDGLAGVLVSDIRLSGRMSGLELVERLRARGDNRPTLLMSGMCGDEDERAAFAAGVAGILRKPFSLTELQEADERLLEPRPDIDTSPHRSN